MRTRRDAAAARRARMGVVCDTLESVRPKRKTSAGGQQKKRGFRPAGKRRLPKVRR